MKKLADFKSIIEVVNYFSDEDFNMKYLEEDRWGGNIVCPHCENDKVYRLEKYKRFKCSGCKKQFNAMTGTIFQGKRISLQKWFVGYSIFLTLPAISSYRLAKELGVTKHTAWFMLQRLRYCLEQTEKDNDDKLSGTIQVDETFVGGKNKNRHGDKKVKNSQGRSFKDKTPVLGIMETETSVIVFRKHKVIPELQVREKIVITPSRLKCFVIPDTKSKSIKPIVKKVVEVDSVVVSDEWLAYKGLNKQYDHRIVDHKKKEYVNINGDTTNALEGSWALFKRAFNIYYHISKKHMNKYVKEFMFKYNTRHMTQKERFDTLLKNTRFHITYNQLIATA
ncbi:MAG TPA: IS1595 family transposase [Saprospiraceae bacterium]|nr:IS1595 family transposase [Saprospiraceae bacterium]